MLIMLIAVSKHDANCQFMSAISTDSIHHITCVKCFCCEPVTLKSLLQLAFDIQLNHLFQLGRPIFLELSIRSISMIGL